MATTKKTGQDHQFWQTHIAQWKKSDLTQANYCQQHDLVAHRFSYYRRKFSEVPTKKKPSAFVSVALQPQPPIQEALALHLPNGMRLSGITSENMLLVKQLASTLS